MDHVEEDGSESLLHVRADPDKEPVVELHGGGEDGTDTRARADGDAATEEMREVGQTGKLCREDECSPFRVKWQMCVPSFHASRGTWADR